MNDSVFDLFPNSNQVLLTYYIQIQKILQKIVKIILIHTFPLSNLTKKIHPILFRFVFIIVAPKHPITPPPS